MSTKYFKLSLFNAGSLGTNHDNFVATMERLAADIVAINETWIKQGEEGNAPSVPEYRLRHIPRPLWICGGHGGGVGFYIRRGLNVSTIDHPIHRMVEQMWLKLRVNGNKLIIGTAYRPPRLDVNLFLDALTDTISTFSDYDYLILLGDFNINLYNKTDSKNNSFNLFLHCVGLKQVVTDSTHFTDTSETLIDVVCTNAPVRSVSMDSVGVINGHAFITVELIFRKPKILPKMICYRPLKEINRDLLEQDLANINWHRMGLLNDIDDIVEDFTKVVNFLFDLHAPMTTRVIRELPAPWLTDNVKFMMRLRDRALKRARITRDLVHKQFYKDLKKQVEVAIFNEKKCYFHLNINSNIQNPKALWKNLKTQLRSHTVTEIPLHLSDSNLINNNFLNIPGNLYTSISQLCYYEFNRFGDKTFSIKTVDSGDVLKVLQGIRSSATGTDGLSIDMINLILPQALDLITTIVNKSIQSAKFPTLWKTAIVKPLPKSNSITSVKDLRPISILPCLSKVLEKVVSLQLTSYLEMHSILPVKQSGFRKKRGTTTALLDVTDNIIAAQDLGQATILVLLDFSRAFDALNISLLMSKLSYYGFDHSTVRWFNSYLSNRSQFVEVRNSDGSTSRSDAKPLNRGVAQGSVLGPILFNIYSADIIHAIKYCNYHIYADDVQIYLSFKPHETQLAVDRINADLNNIFNWAYNNSLVLNASKTKFMILGSKGQINKVSQKNPYIAMNGSVIERVLEARNLGLIMDDALRFERHISDVVRNCFYRLKLLYKLRQYLSTDLRVQLTDSLVLSKFNYLDVVYGPRLLAKTSSLIQRVQNACARFCFDIPRRGHVTPFLNEGNLLKMKWRRGVHLATLMFGIVKDKVPEYLFEKLEWMAENKGYASRELGQPLHIPRHRTTAFRGGFRYNATKCWNNLPPPLRKLGGVGSFKINLKKWYLSEQKSST